MNIVNRISKTILSQQQSLIASLSPLSSNFINRFLFSKIKKAKPEIKTPSIHINKFKQNLDGFLIYQNEEGHRIKAISIAFIVCFLSGFWTYSKINDDEIKVNYMIMGGILAIPFLIFQFRTAKTLKRLILDKNGENVILSRFVMAGFGQENTKVKIQVLKGIGKAFAFGGSVIKGGGMYGFQQRNYWFQSKYILEKDVFQEIAQGNRVKIDRSKVYE